MNASKNFSNTSKKFREEGNSVYKSINESLAPCLREARLMKCLNLYQQSINLADSEEEKSSAFKNHAVVSLELFRFHSKNNYSKNKSKFYMEESQKSFLQAKLFGNRCKSLEWIEQIDEKLFKSISSYYETFVIYENDEDVQVNLLVNLKKNTEEQIICVVDYYIALIYYKSSIKKVEYDLIKSLRAINECNYYYEECLKRSFDIKSDYFDFDDTLVELNTNKLIQECIVDSLKHKRIADIQLDAAINEEESLDIEKLWDCVDLYHEAIIKTKDKDIELEAEVLSKLGLVYGIMGDKIKAKAYYYQCFNLAETMRPKIFTHKSWYIRCCNKIKEFQKEILDEEEKIKEMEKNKVLDKITPDLLKIKKQAETKDMVAFINFVYADYPSKNENVPKNFVLKKGASGKETKKAFKNALIHYHPDKNSGNKYGFEWHFIVVEISKFLGSFYEQLK